MNKREFLRSLSASLRGMPRGERAQSLEYYGEMIQDRMEEGLSEEEAVARLGSADEIARQILESNGPKEKGSGRAPVWMIALIVLGSPVWLALLFAVLAVMLAAYIVAWSLIAALYAVLLGMAVCGPLGALCFVAEIARATSPVRRCCWALAACCWDLRCWRCPGSTAPRLQWPMPAHAARRGFCGFLKGGRPDAQLGEKNHARRSAAADHRSGAVRGCVCMEWLQL